MAKQSVRKNISQYLHVYINSENRTENVVEDVKKTHVQLRSLFNEEIEDWQKTFQTRAELTTNFEDFIERNLSFCGINVKDGYHAGYRSQDYGVSIYHLKGYDCAVGGDNPYMDEIAVPGVGTPIDIISQNLYDFMEGYLWSMRDSYVMEFKINGKEKDIKNDPAKLTKLTGLLHLYYLKGCKELRKYEVYKLAEKEGINEKVMENRWIKLKGNHYRHNGNVNNVREFLKSYETLMRLFKDQNNTAFNNVKNHYEQLKETYPDLTY